jgi:hypothetical protein
MRELVVKNQQISHSHYLQKAWFHRDTRMLLHSNGRLLSTFRRSGASLSVFVVCEAAVKATLGWRLSERAERFVLRDQVELQRHL